SQNALMITDSAERRQENARKEGRKSQLAPSPQGERGVKPSSVAGWLVAGKRRRLRRFAVDRPAADDDASLLDVNGLELQTCVAQVTLEPEQGDRVARWGIAVPAHLDVVLLGDFRQAIEERLRANRQ